MWFSFLKNSSHRPLNCSMVAPHASNKGSILNTRRSGYWSEISRAVGGETTGWNFCALTGHVGELKSGERSISHQINKHRAERAHKSLVKSSFHFPLLSFNSCAIPKIPVVQTGRKHPTDLFLRKIKLTRAYTIGHRCSFISAVAVG